VGEISQAAAAVVEHVGRFQVYGDREQIDHAMAEAERLFVNLRRLKLGLRRCIDSSLRNEPSARLGIADHSERSRRDGKGAAQYCDVGHAYRTRG
jgi:hypothetical protein